LWIRAISRLGRPISTPCMKRNAQHLDFFALPVVRSLLPAGQI
jgi:hypothetical protein